MAFLSLASLLGTQGSTLENPNAGALGSLKVWISGYSDRNDCWFGAI